MWNVCITAQKMKFSIKYFFSKCDQTAVSFRIWSHLMKKSWTENFIFCAVYVPLFLHLLFLQLLVHKPQIWLMINTEVNHAASLCNLVTAVNWALSLPLVISDQYQRLYSDSTPCRELVLVFSKSTNVKDNVEATLFVFF